MVMTHIAENDVLLVAATECATMRPLQQLPLVANTQGVWPCAREQVGGVCGEGDDFVASYRHSDACRIQYVCVRERERGRGGGERINIYHVL